MIGRAVLAATFVLDLSELDVCTRDFFAVVFQTSPNYGFTLISEQSMFRSVSESIVTE